MADTASTTAEIRDSHRRTAREIAGFTLIEVLVVAAIIALLSAILIPSMRHARLAAKRTQCCSNVHQQLVVYFNYAHSYRGHFPVNPTQEPYNTYIWSVVDFNCAVPYDLRVILKRDALRQFKVFTCPMLGGPDMDDPVNEPFIRTGERWMGGHFLPLYNSIGVFKDPQWVSTSGARMRPWAPTAEWGGGGYASGVPIVQDLYFLSSGLFYINHADRPIPLLEHEMKYHAPHCRYRMSYSQDACTGINVGYLDGSGRWARNAKVAGTTNRYTLNMPWSQATAGILTVRAGFLP